MHLKLTGKEKEEMNGKEETYLPKSCGNPKIVQKGNTPISTAEDFNYKFASLAQNFLGAGLRTPLARKCGGLVV